MLPGIVVLLASSSAAGTPPAVCGSCHALPPADALPRSSWEQAIDEMTALAGQPVSPTEAAAAKAASPKPRARAPWVPMGIMGTRQQCSRAAWGTIDTRGSPWGLLEFR